MKLKKSTIVIIEVLIVIGLCIAMAVICFLFRRQADNMVKTVVDEWKEGNIGSVGEDFRDVPEKVLVKMLPEIQDPELQELFELYEYKEGSGDADADYSEEEYNVEVLSDEEYRELMETEYSAFYEADQVTEESTGSSEQRNEVYEAVKRRIEVSYKLPVIIIYPLKVDVTVTSPSVEDAYYSAGKDYDDVIGMQDAMVDYIESGKAKTITESRTIKFYKSGGKVYAEPDADIANVIAGGYPDLIARVLTEAEE